MAGLFGRRSLEKHGRRAKARVIEPIKLTSSTSPASTTTSGLYAGVKEHWKVRISVEPEGEAPFELETKITFPRDEGEVRPGLIFPVLYDPDDHERIEYDPVPRTDAQVAADTVAGRGLTDRLPAGLDVEDLVTRWQEDPKAAREQIRAQYGSGSAFPAPGTPGAPAEDPVDKLARLADLRDRGALTDAEFEAQKARILGEG